MKKFMAALLAFAAVILFAGCGGKTVDTDSTLQGESIDADAQTNSDGQASKVISAYYLGIGLDKESRWKMTEEDKQSADGNYIKNKATEYDSHGNPLSSDTDTYKYTYNGDGTVKEITRSGSRECVYSYKYDSDKKISQISTLNASGKEEDVLKFTYNKSGKLISAQSGSKKAVFSYDGNGGSLKKTSPTPMGIQFPIFLNITTAASLYARQYRRTSPAWRIGRKNINMTKTAC